MRSHTGSKTFVALVLALGAAASHAAIVSYTTQPAWSAAVNAVGIDTFDNILSNDPIPGPVLRSTSSGTPYGYTASVGPFSGLLYGAGSGADHWLSQDVASDILRFSSIGPSATAVGGLFFGSDIRGLFLPDGRITVVVSAGAETASQTIANATLNSFVGFTTTSPIDSVTVTSSFVGNAIWPTVNNLAFAVAGVGPNVVPEPGVLALLCAGLLGCFGVSRARARPH